MGEKLAPGECTIPDGEDQPICNREGELVHEDLGDVEDEELIEEPPEQNESFGDKIAKVWNKTP